MVTETTKREILSATRVPPGDLWHYTTIDVLECFLKGEIAFSHYKFMNDDAELSYGRQLLLKVFEGLKDWNIKDILGGNVVDDMVENAYLFCLSRDGDNLYQWRSYTQQGGIAIGFDRQKLHEAICNGVQNDEWLPWANRVSGMLIPCRYQDDFAKRVVQRLNQRPQSGCCHGCKDFGLYLEKILKMLLAQKNPSFKEEQEERFVLTGVPREMVVVINMKPRVLVRDSNIAKSISCVRLSPHGDRERNKLFVEILRDKYRFDFKIEQSISSYNGK